jgi:hypothetical protein
MNIYIICAVRKATEEEKKVVLDYAEQKEKEGYTVRCPFRDTNQEDEVGIRIVEEHEDDIIWADEVHAFWKATPEGKSTSEGSLWDAAQTRMAMRYSPEKKFLMANIRDVGISEQKSYTNVLLATHYGLAGGSTLEDLRNKKSDQA